ncbi:Pleckstrin homology domain-containing family A member 6 [Geodia barretti]|nr:Pleckstrin homology domain-containing family A member 6 [Geodia barretti]
MDNGDLHYYDSPDKSGRPVGTLHIRNCRRLFDPRSKGLQFPYTLGLDLSDSLHYIKADTAPTYNAWLEMMAGFAVRNDASPASSHPSPSGQRRYSGFPEVKGHRGDASDTTTSRTFSMSAKVQSRSADKSGWLYKTGPNNKGGWNHRFFVLSNGKLTYFKTEKAEKSQGTIDLRECSGVSQANLKRGYGLIIQVPNRTYYISAETESEQQDWVLAITTALSLLDDSKLSVAPAEALVRSGSGSSGSSVTSRDLLSLPTSDPQTTPTTLNTAGEFLLSVEEDTVGGGGQDKKQEKDSVVQLLEAEVDALRGQVSGLREELVSRGAVTAQLHAQLEESARQREREVHSITVDRDNIHTKLLDLEAEELRVRGELEETQAALATAEDDIKTYQQELSDTQQLLQEIQSVALDLQAELIRRGDFVPRHFIKNRSLSSTASELLSPLDISSLSLPLSTHLECEERPATVAGFVGEMRGQVESPVANTPPGGEREEGKGGGATLPEERLKWQMEMENLRRECEARETGERARCEEEVGRWREKVGELEERCREMMGEVEREKSKELEKTKERLVELEGEVGGARERAAQLQVEKEKALADLKNIRKINRTMEKKLSESGKQDSEPQSPPVPDERLEEISKQLDLVTQERDKLKAELEELRASITNGLALSGGDDTAKVSPFLMRKSRATVAASRHSFAAPAVPSPLTNGHPEDVPVKPQRPSKAVITGRLAAVAPPTGSRPRSRTTTLFQSLLHS